LVLEKLFLLEEEKLFLVERENLLLLEEENLFLLERENLFLLKLVPLEKKGNYHHEPNYCERQKDSFSQKVTQPITVVVFLVFLVCI
jgi:hypothetical protein